MDKKVIKITVKDGGNDKTFNVRLFGALEGMDFLDNFVSSGKVSIKDIAGDLLPLATLIGADGKPIDTMSMDKVDTYFQNPLAVLELAYKIFQHQMVFMNESETFRKLIPTVENMFNMPSSDSTMQ